MAVLYNMAVIQNPGYRSTKMIWYWSEDERGETLMTAQEVYETMMSTPLALVNKRTALIEGIEEFLSVANASGSSGDS